MSKKIYFIPIIAIALFTLTGCDQVNQKLGLEDTGKKEAKLEAEGKAVGSACRHSGRAIEDCYAIYSWLPKASVFEGWREMDTYMRDNKIETIVPLLPPPEAPGNAKKKKKLAADEAEAADAKTESKASPAAQTPAASEKSSTKH